MSVHALRNGPGLALAGVLWLSVGCGSPPPRPNVFVIVMDTVRQDHLSCYGYPRNTTPNLTELLRESRRYENAYSVSSWTGPAHASLFTGLHPVAHRCTQERWRLEDGLRTLAELLRDAGYHTLGITENPVISAANGFDQGFDAYHETWRTDPRHRTSGPNPAYRLFRESLAALDDRRPFFFFINFIEPHNPYDSSREYLPTFVTDGSISLRGHNPRLFYLGQRRYSPAELDHLTALYDAEILYVDALIGRIVADLRQSGRWDDTLLVITSDHGENIGDHGHIDHYFSLYESTTKIPLLIRYPPAFAADSIDDDPVQLTDVFPTVASLLQLDPGTAQGTDLLDGEGRADRPVICEYYRPVQALMTFGDQRDSPALDPFRRHLRSIRDGRLKLIWASDGRHELYDLAADPGETTDLLRSVDPATAEFRRLSQRLDGLLEGFARDRIEPSQPFDEQLLDQSTRDALRGLGYID